jgi:ferric-dicitrate binding protein FerR (iron transport regulator)|tara:strand:+ start:2269 stop:3333 length:1065 start_codon:yes stop_codon:yes gene_type:complete
MNDIHLLMMDESFQRWLSGQATSEEKKQWEDWLKESPNGSILYEQAKSLWDGARYKAVEIPDVDMEWQRLNIALNQEKKPSHSPRTSIFSSPKFFKTRGSIIKRNRNKIGALAFVSMVVISLLIGKHMMKTFNQEQTRVISTGYGQRTFLTFLEGTKIILNANSRLEYPTEWKSNTKRRVILEGEAFFDVSDLPSSPHDEFIVQTEDGMIKVVGTKFAVHKRGSKTRVAVEEGEVEVSSMRQTTEGNEYVIMHPNQLLAFNKESRELTPRDVNIRPYTTWWQEEYVLDRTPFHEIVNRIEETYGVTVIVQENELLNRTLSGSFGNENLTVITHALGIALDVDVQWENKTITFGS